MITLYFSLSFEHMAYNIYLPKPIQISVELMLRQSETDISID